MILRPHQQVGAAWLAERARGYLADEPGVGKTRTLLAAAAAATQPGERVAVACPAIVRAHWRAEAAIVTPALALDVESYATLVTSAARRRAWFGTTPPAVLILDEAHALKHATSRRTKLFYLSTTGLVHQGVRHVWPASGTPMPRNPSELYAVLLALFPERLRALRVDSWKAFLDRYCKYRMTDWGLKVYGAKNIQEFRQMIAPVFLRRPLLAIESQLPPLRWGIVTLTAEDLAAYALPELAPETVAALRAGQLPPIDENLARYRHAVGDAKAPLAARLVRDELMAEPGATRVVFAYHHSVLDRLERDLCDFGICRIDGTTSDGRRRMMLELFRRGPRRVFLGQLGACATGMDGLQYRAHEAVMVEPDWSTDVNVQAGGRIARVGQTYPAQVRMLALAGTLDEAILRNHHREVEMVRTILDGEENDV